MDGREVFKLGIGGGPIDVRIPGPAKLWRGLTDPGVGLEPTEGVIVLGVEAPDAPAEPSCFVGDLVGDCSTRVSDVTGMTG